jgi:DNA-binding SARP family transcriptional activator
LRAPGPWGWDYDLCVSIEVRVLGPLEVVCDGRLVAVPGGKERALVVRLALEAGRVVSRERLFGSLWNADPPVSAEASLRVLVSRVRKVLAGVGAGRVVETRGPGYVLWADDVDALRFELLVSRGREEISEGRPARAAVTLAMALSLWRGDRLAEASAADLRSASTRLEQLRLAACEARIEADLACGRHAAVLPELEALCAVHPLRESLWALRMTALYRSQRQADALAIYQDLRRLLRDELGIDPSPTLQHLEAAVLTHDPALAAPATPAPGPALAVPERRQQMPLPDLLGAVERLPMVGRELELEAARAAWAAAHDGAPGVLLVRGEAGIGKSRLVRELAREAHRQGAVVLYGRCDEDLTIPYRPVVECLAHAVAHVPDELLATVGPHLLSELTRLVPGLAGRRPGLPAPAAASADVERYALFGAVASFLGVVARDDPVMVILDDLHWADRPTLLLVRHLAGLRLTRVLLVGAYRDPGQPDGPLIETLGALARQQTVIRIDPPRLSPAHAVALLAAAAGGDPDEAGSRLAEFLHHETEGNPFYLVEMLEHAKETGMIAELAAREPASNAGFSRLSLPDSIREVLRARVARLGPDAARLLPVAAVIGQEFDLDLLAGVAGMDPGHVLDLLDAAGRAGLVSEPAPGMAQPEPAPAWGGRAGRFRFAHALVQHTLYADISPARRTRLHGQVARSMEAIGDRQPGELAFHLLAGITPATASKAIHYARAAGERALATSAPDEAVRWYTAVLSTLPPPRDDAGHAQAMIDLGIAQRLAGQPAYRDTLLTAARIAQDAGRGDLLAEAALASSRGSFSRLGEVDAEKIALIEAALAVVPPGSTQRARLLANLSAELTWEPDHTRRLALADAAVAEARRAGDPATLIFAIVRPGPARWVPETSAERAKLFQEAADLAERSNDPIGRFEAINLLVPTLMEQASPDSYDDELDAAAQTATEVREPFMRWISLYIRGCVAIARGQLELAEDQAAAALRTARDGGLPEAEAAHDEQLYLIRWQQGRLAEMLDHYRTVGGLIPDVSTRRAELALAEAITGDRSSARAALHQAAGHRFASLYGPAWLACMCLWADVAAELADHDAAATLYQILVPWKSLFATGGPLPIHAVSLALGRLATLLGRPETAGQHFSEAMRIHEAVRSPFGTATTALHWGQLLLDHDPPRARTLLALSADIAQRHGLSAIELPS